MEDDLIKLKILTVGDSGVGKSWLILRWSSEPRSSKAYRSILTIGIDFKTRFININEERIKIQIWDTAGHERFRTITASFYRNSHGIILVYDITDRKSFTSIRSWISQIQTNADVNINIILIGNKCDLVEGRVVTQEEGELLAKEFNIPFIETSAMTDVNIEDALMRICKDIYVRIANESNNNNKLRTKINTTTTFSNSNARPKSNGCC